MASQTVQVNRAPVLTLWAAVVAERLGYVQLPTSNFQPQIQAVTSTGLWLEVGR